MALSNMMIVSDGNLEFVSISFNYLDRSEINVYFDSVPTSTWVWVGNTNQIKFTPKVPNGVTVLITRTTDASDLRHIFSKGAAFTAKSLDEDLRQVLHIVQEARETNLAGDFYSDVDMHGNKVTNLAPGSNPSDAVTFQQLQDLSPDTGLRQELAKDYLNTGSGLVGFQQASVGAIGRSVESKLRDLISLDDYVDIAHAVSAAISSSKKVYIPFDTTLRIPADAPSLQSAIDHTYVYPGVQVTLLIQSAHKLTDGVIVRSGDFSHYSIESEDPTVYLDVLWPTGQSVLTGYDARMPVWAIMLDCEGKEVSGLETGVINVTHNSSLVIEPGCGAINGGSNSNGLFVYRNSKVTGYEAVFTDFGINNVWITHISDGYLEKLIATGAGQYGVFASRASRVYMTGGDVSGAGTYGLCIRRSYVVALPFGSSTPPKFNNCGVFGVYVSEGSTFMAPERNLLRPQFSGNPTHILAEAGSLVYTKGAFSNSSSHAVNITSRSKAILDGSTFTLVTGSVIRCSDSEICAISITGQNAGASGIVAQASIVNAPGANLSNAGSYGVHAYDGSLVSAPNVNVSNAGLAGLNVASSSVVADFVTATGCGTGLVATDMSTVSVKQGVLTGYTANGIIANRGSRVMAHSANAQKAGTNTTADAVVGSGGVIVFVNAAGGSNVVSNTFTANGTLYQ